MPTPFRASPRGRPLRLLTVFSTLIVWVIAGSSVPGDAQLDPLVAGAEPAVVLVAVKHALFGEAIGSGFVYDPSGFILTNQHVVEGALAIVVILHDQRSFPATVVDYARRMEVVGDDLRLSDVAVLKIDATGLPALPLGNSASLRRGQDLVVLGHPGGDLDVSAIRGGVGTLRSGWFEIGAPIRPGNSGGPVIDSGGRVVGLTTLGLLLHKDAGGVVAIDTIRAVAESALLPDSSRYREVRVTGMEYAPPPALYATTRWRTTYGPGITGAQPSVRERTQMVTRVEALNGASLATITGSDGSETRDYSGALGVVEISARGGGWRYSFPKPIMLLPFPPLVGLSWWQKWNGENQAGEMHGDGTTEYSIDHADEVVTVPAGTFSHVIEITGVGRETFVHGGQTTVRHVTIHGVEGPPRGDHSGR